MIQFRHHIVLIGCGSVAQCALPLLFKLIDISPKAVTVIDFADKRSSIQSFIDQGVQYRQERLTEDNYQRILNDLLSKGDLLIDLSWNLDTGSLIDLCQQRGALYLNTSIELWNPFDQYADKDPRELTLYHRHMKLKEKNKRWKSPTSPTAIVDHGANPGLVSHFAKQGLIDIAEARLKQAMPAKHKQKIEQALADLDFPHLAQALGLKTIHISERDTQITNQPKEANEFVNTWSIEGLIEEGMAPAEMGWGTHERTIPPGALSHAEGPRNQICLPQKGIKTWARSWVPSGPIIGMVIRHGESFSISQFLTVYEKDEVVYRPTVHYAYCPSDSTMNSLHELSMRAYIPQQRQRILTNEIIAGADELGCLMMGHDLNAWWIGSSLTIKEARRLIPGQNATTVQVAIGVVAAAIYAIRHPTQGFCLPDDLDHQEILAIAKPYLGDFISRQVDWSPLKEAKTFLDFNESLLEKENNEWQFMTFKA